MQHGNELIVTGAGGPAPPPRAVSPLRTDGSAPGTAAAGSSVHGVLIAEMLLLVGVDDYLIRFNENAHRLLSEQPADFPAPVSATWVMLTA